MARFSKRVIDETGNRYGKLLVLEFHSMNEKNHNAMWLCLCDCGNKIAVQGTALRRGNTTSCPCTRKEKVGRLNRLPRGMAARNHLLTSYRRSAQRREISWGLTREQFFALTKQRCHYCGIEPSKVHLRGDRSLNGGYSYNGVDRVDNNRGYVIDNVVPCCRECNNAKHTMSVEKFHVWVDRVFFHSLGL